MDHPALIINRHSGPSILRQQKERLPKLAHELGWRGTLYYADNKNQTIRSCVQEAVQLGATSIMIAGGDGSIMEALSVLAKTDVHLGIIPMGSGNIFAQNLQIPLSIPAALKVALHGKALPVDIGRTKHQVFGVMAGIGWDAATVRDADRRLKDKISFLAYYVSALKNARHRKEKYWVQIDNGARESYLAKSVIVANLGRINARLKLFPKTDHASGTLDIVIVRAESFRSWVSVIVNGILHGFSDSPELVIRHGTSVRVWTRRKQPIQLDGNDFPPQRELIASVQPAAVMIRVSDRFYARYAPKTVLPT